MGEWRGFSRTFNLVNAGKAGMAGAMMLTLATQSRAGYSLPNDAATRTSTNIAVDGHCNLTEAIASLNAGHPINSDCHSLDSYYYIDLTAAGGSVPVYELASGTTITSATAIDINTPSEYPAEIEASGPSVFTINAGASLILEDIVVNHKSGSTGRVITNHGSFSAYFSTFQNGDLSGGAWPSNGGGIYNDGVIDDLGYCLIQNNKAPNGSGGGIYNLAGTIGNGGEGLAYSAVTNNIAAQGGGIYSVRNSPNQGQLTISGSSIYQNKTIASEVTSGGTVASSGGSQCSSSEAPSNAFDDNFNTKWCNTGSGSPSTGSPVIVSYQFSGGAKQRVQSYSVTSANDAPGRDPTDWTLEGANASGGPWTVLDTKSTEVFWMPYATVPAQGGRHLSRTYYFNNANSYAFYRLKITKNNGSNPAGYYPGSGTASKITQIAELQLYPDWKTGDGGGLFYTTHANFDNSTFSRNIAGCTNSSCACPAGDNWCASPTNTSSVQGKGGAIFAPYITPENGYNDVGETFANNLTVAGNSASQGGGFYQNFFDHWNFTYCLFGNNKARTNVSQEPDFHGNPHSFDSEGGNLFSSSAGLVSTNEGGFPGGFQTTGEYPDKVSSNPGINPVTLIPSSDFSGSYAIHIPFAGGAAVDGTGSTDAGYDERGASRPSGSSNDFGAVERQPTDP